MTVIAMSTDGMWAQLADGSWIAAVLLAQQSPSKIETASTKTSTPARRLVATATATTALRATSHLTVTLLDAAAFTATFSAALTPAFIPTQPITVVLQPTPFAIQLSQPIALRNANLRRGPGTNYAVVGGVRANETLAITGQTGDGSWVQLQDGSWIAAFLVDEPVSALPTVSAVLIAALPTAAPTATPTPTPTVSTVASDASDGDSPTEAVPTTAPARAEDATNGNTTFVLTRRRLWNPWENGGSMDGPSVHCGQGRNLTVNVLDENGNRLNGVAVQAQYGAKEIYVSGSQGKGDGVVEFVLGSGQDVKVVRDADGSPVTSEVAVGLATDPRGIDQESLLSAGYCQDNESCRTFVNNLSCIGHFSWTVTFERRR
ncbi:MAG: SH3 domain-containing protein [Caldilineaceae bacterium]